MRSCELWWRPCELFVGVDGPSLMRKNLILSQLWTLSHLDLGQFASNPLADPSCWTRVERVDCASAGRKQILL